MGRLLFADDGALLKRGRNLGYAVKKNCKIVMRFLVGLDWGDNIMDQKLLGGLDLIQARALRLCKGTVRSSPVCVETSEMPLCLHRKHLLVDY